MVWTPAERRGALVVAFLLALGTVYDLWRARPGRAPAVLDVTALGVARTDSAGGAADTVVARSAAARPAHAGRIDVNVASVAELDALPGIGPVIAGRIVEHREQHGRFRRVDDLLAVRGVGPRLLERLESRVHVAP